MSDDEGESTVIVHSTTVVTSYGGGGGGGDDDDGDDCGGDSPQGGGGSQQTYRIYTKVGPQFAMAVRDGRVILASSNACDESQHWIKDLKYGADRQDEEGFPSFALINKETGEALKHAPTPDPVILAPFCPDDDPDDSLLWSHSQLFGDGFRTIRKVTNIRDNLDAWVGGEEQGFVRDGSKIVLYNFTTTPNQLWKIEPYCKICELSIFTYADTSIPSSTGWEVV